MGVRDRLENRGIERRINLNCGVEYGLDRSGSGHGQVAGTFEYGNEPSGSVKRGEFLTS